MMTGVGKSVWFVSVVALLASCAPWLMPARAQGQAKEEAGRALEEVEEITVTAEKREQRLQEAPAAITALTSETIEEKGVETVQDVAQYTPNLHVHPNAGGNTGATINMRGAITSDPIITLEPTVGVYLNGAYIAKSVGGGFDADDLERIEVLRGPQGTLYGRNTVGGAINLITKRPTDQIEATLRSEVGNFDYFKGGVTLNAPLVGKNGVCENDALGKLILRTTGAYRLRDGFYENTGAGSSDFDDLDRISNVSTLRWQPAEAATLDYDFDYNRVRERTTAFQLSGIRPGSPASQIPGLDGFIATHREDAIANNAVARPDGSTQQLRNNLDVRGHALTGSYHFGDTPLGDLTLKSITAYRSLDQFEAQDLDGTPIALGDFTLRAEHHGWSEELQMLGSVPRVEYVAGAYYYGERGSEDNPQVLFQAFFNPDPQLNGKNIIFSKNKFENTALAPFGQVTWTPPIFSDKLSLTGGLRYSNEHKQAARVFCPWSGNMIDAATCRDTYAALVAGGVIPASPDFGAEAGRTFSSWTPMGNVAYQFTDEVMAYVKVSRGFKSGGFNGRAFNGRDFRNPFKNETLLAYEGGVKSQWLDNRLRVNAAGFYSDYDNLQVTVFRADPVFGAVTNLENAASAKIFGSEFELSATPLRGLEASVGYGFLSPEYDEFCGGRNDPTDPSKCTEDLTDTAEFILSPEHTISASLGYTAPPTSTGTFSARLDFYWQDDVFFATKDNEFTSQGEYSLLDGRIQLAGIPVQDGELDVAVFAKNLADRKYRTFGIDFGDRLGWAGNTYGNPRTIGLQLTWHWQAS